MGRNKPIYIQLALLHLLHKLLFIRHKQDDIPYHLDQSATPGNSMPRSLSKAGKAPNPSMPLPQGGGVAFFGGRARLSPVD